MNGYFPPNVQGVIRLSRMPFPDFGIQVEGGSAAIERRHLQALPASNSILQ